MAEYSNYKFDGVLRELDVEVVDVINLKLLTELPTVRSKWTVDLFDY